jgi:hypothetical protein
VVEDDGFQYKDGRSTRYAFNGWVDTDNLLISGSSLITTVSADPGVSGLTANVTVEHQVVLNFFEGFGDPPSMSPSACGAPGPALPNEFRTGVVHIDGVCYWNGGLIWMREGRHTLNAFPYPGFVFLGWKAGNQGSSAYLREFNFLVQGPLTIVPRFAPAKRVRFRTDPPGLKVMVDRAESPTTDAGKSLLLRHRPDRLSVRHGGSEIRTGRLHQFPYGSQRAEAEDQRSGQLGLKPFRICSGDQTKSRGGAGTD